MLNANISFTAVENLRGGSAQDDFFFDQDTDGSTTGAISGTLDAGEGMDSLVYSVGGDADLDGEIGGLLDGDTYLVGKIDATTIRLARSPDEANQAALTLFGSDAFSGDQIDLGYDHGLRNGDAVVYDSGAGADIAGLVNGRTYYVVVVDTSRIQLAEAILNADAGRVLDLDLAGHPGSGNAHSLRLALDPVGVTGTNQNIGKAFDPTTSVVASFESIDLGYEHGFKTGQEVMYLAGGGTPIEGLDGGKIYYVVVDPDKPTAIQLSASSIDALLPNPNVIDLTSPVDGGNSHGFAVPFDPNYAEAAVDADDGVDDGEGGILANLTEIIATYDLTPDGASDTSGTYHSLRRPFTADRASINDTSASDADIINLGYDHGFTTGQKVLYSHGGGGGLGAWPTRTPNTSSSSMHSGFAWRIPPTMRCKVSTSISTWTR